MLREATLQYLRYGDSVPDEEEGRRIDKAIEDVSAASVPRVVHRIFPLSDTDGVKGIDAKLDLHYGDLQNLLAGSEACLLIAGTLGAGLDLLLKRTAKLDMAQYVRMDAAANALIESTLDRFEEGLPVRDLTFRFSPGYGDVPLTLQRQLLAVLEAHKRIGLALTDSLLMTPTKSISGIVGIGGLLRERSCTNCQLFETCEFRRNNTVCYTKKK